MAAMLHSVPKLPAFVDVRSDDPISEFALRVVVERSDWRFDVIGTAFVVTGHLAVTAKHVMQEIIERFGCKAGPTGQEIEDYSVKLYQVLPGPEYRIWAVFSAWMCPISDIAILHLGLAGTTIADDEVEWKQPVLRALPPQQGERVIAFGYRASRIGVREDEQGVHHIELNDRPTNAIGIVQDVHPQGRDRVMLPFPCFGIEARIDGGMSGGLVLDEQGAVCGLISVGMNRDEDELPISYAASLLPMLQTTISADRGPGYPKAEPYPMIDLALTGIIRVKDLAHLDRGLFPGRVLPTASSALD